MAVNEVWAVRAFLMWERDTNGAEGELEAKGLSCLPAV